MQNAIEIYGVGNRRRSEQASARRFGLLFVLFCAASAVIIGSWPLQLSIATVFLFAGPHNWMEFRYFLGRLPVRWGRSRTFYAVGLSGVAVLAGAYLLLYLANQSWYLNPTTSTLGISAWNTAMILWLATLVLLRGRQRKGRDWSWIFGPAFLLCALSWAAPVTVGWSMVFIHPLIAMWFFDRQLKRSRPQWQRTYRMCLGLVPVIVLLLFARFGFAQNLPDGDGLSWRITHHAGADLFTGVSSHFLVATHVFLEVVHYAIWIVLIPSIALKTSFWKTSDIPMIVNRAGWPKMTRIALLAGAGVVIALWVGFAANYTSTRDIYFALAIGHVLAEAPFLIRIL
jgi:hypothetical protein